MPDNGPWLDVPGRQGIVGYFAQRGADIDHGIGHGRLSESERLISRARLP
jgi:hypothetical protein